MPTRTSWLVEYLAEVVLELQAIEAKKERAGVLNAVDKLMALGPSLAPPHMKPLQGEPNLMELRPRQGQSPVRPIYVRVGDGFKILAIATKSDFDGALSIARKRAAQYSIPLGRS
jgi:hypothetical protein